MALTVDPRYLRGYAEQIDGNRTGALTALERYCATYCADTTGLTGLLAVAREAVTSTGLAFEQLMTNGERGLSSTAADLRRTAADYDRTDVAAADAIWLTGRRWTVPAGYREHDVTVVSSGFSHGATVTLPVPPEHHDAQRARASIIATLGNLDRVITWITGYDLLAEAMPIVFGEWGTLRRIARAHDEMERGYDLIAQDLTDGMDTLSTHWTSDDGASTAFDYDIRRRWIRGFRGLADASNAAQQAYEWMADAYEYIVNAFLLALNFYARRIKRALALAGDDEIGIGRWAFTIYQLVTTTVQLIIDTIRMIYLQTRMFIAALQMVGANLRYLFDQIRGDLDVFGEA